MNEGYVLAGYLLTGAALGGYVLRLFARLRIARRRAQAITRRRSAGPAGNSAS